MIPFNKLFLTGKESHYIYEAVYKNAHISGNGEFTKKCHKYFESNYRIKKCLLTTSCTDALEMAAILCNINQGDEVIVPSYTFVSTAIAFVRQGAKIVFADSYRHHPNLNADLIEALITPKTKVIVPVHYGGVACDMDKIMALANKYNLLVVEDAAQAIDSFYISPQTGKKIPLGTIGNFGCFSFHETKNIIAGEGGMLAINDEKFKKRSEIIWEKGTNRAAFFRGEVSKYGWVDIGSSFLPSETIAAFLWAQIQNIRDIQQKRLSIWNKYFQSLAPLSAQGFFQSPSLPNYASNNAHLFYMVLKSVKQRTDLINKLKDNGIQAVFHYQSLHKSEYYKDKLDNKSLPQSEKYSDHLLRLPFFCELTDNQIDYIVRCIYEFYDASL